MELLQLKYFRSVAECGKINTAAAELYISPPALSASISRLEKELGVRLFDRTNNRITLNEQGEIFLMYVNQIFNNLESSRIDIENSLRGRSATIQIASTMSDLWMELIAAYSDAYPEITLSLTALKIPQLSSVDLFKQYSFLLAESGLKQDALDSAVLFCDHPLVMLPRTHPLAKRKKIELHELENEVIFLPMAEQSLNKQLRKTFQDHGFTPKRANEFSFSVCQYMVANGRGISFTTQYTQHTIGRIKCIPLSDKKSRWEQCLYWNKNREFTPEELAFKDFVVQFYQNTHQKTSG